MKKREEHIIEMKTALGAALTKLRVKRNHKKEGTFN
jgi:hypothetical protein